MTHHTDAEQERASLGAFIDRAGRDGFDTAHTFFDCGGVVFFNPDTADLWGFWQAARRDPAVPVTPVTDAMREAAEEAYMPFGDMHLAIQAALAAAPQPPEAAPVQLPEYGIDTANHAGIRVRGYTEQQVRELLAAHGIQEKQGWKLSMQSEFRPMKAKYTELKLAA